MNNNFKKIFYLFKFSLMNSFLLNLFFFTSLNLISQIKIINSTGGVSKINWDYIFKQNKDNQDEQPFVYGSGCTEGPSYSSASSKLTQSGTITYASSNLMDWDPRTAWVEGKVDYGIGEYFEVDLAHGSYNIAIFNGYQKSYDTWINNSRVKKMKVYGDNKLICYVLLKDLMGYQNFDLPTDEVFKKYKFEILEVYPGLKWKDVAISEITSVGCCFALETKILSGHNFVTVNELTKESTIKSVNFNTNQLIDNNFVKTVKTNHHTLLRIQTTSNVVEITPYHPLYIKNYGVTSLLRLRQSDEFCSYEEMKDKIEVLIWNDEKKEPQYIKITEIEVIKGNFETFSIQKLSHGNNYIINGFITSVY
jgi:hypothetical protein